MKGAHITQVLPFMKPFTGSKCIGEKKKSYRFGLKSALRKKMGLKMPKTDVAIENDPFLRLGKFRSAQRILSECSGCFRDLGSIFSAASYFLDSIQIKSYLLCNLQVSE